MWGPLCISYLHWDGEQLTTFYSAESFYMLEGLCVSLLLEKLLLSSLILTALYSLCVLMSTNEN